MPNWCEGFFKVRGKKEDVKRFCLEGLGHPDDGADPKPLYECSENSFLIMNTCWIKDTHRGFIDAGEVYFDNDSDEVIAIFDARFAWGCEAERLTEQSKNFNVDFRFQGFECGMQFSQVVEIHKGQIVLDECVEYDNWEWECVLPSYGG